MIVNRYYLAVDIGASSGHHILGWMENGKINLREIYHFSNGMEMVDGTSCWNLAGFFEKVKVGMKECKKLGINPESVRADTWVVDFVLLGKQGHVLDKTAGYEDGCTEGMDLKVHERISREELHRRIGIQKRIFGAVCRLMAMKERQPDIPSQAESSLMMPDYLNFLLTRVQRQEYTNATITQLVNPSERIQDGELTEALGYPQKPSGRLSIPGTAVGRLSEDVQKGTGLDYWVVFPTTHGTGSAAAVVPPDQDHVLYISPGTWSLMRTKLRDADCREMGMETNFTNEGGYEYRYHFLKNIMRLWMIQSMKKEWKESGGDYPSGEICRRASCETISSIVNCSDSRFPAPESMYKVAKTYCEGSGQQAPKIEWEMAAVIYNSLAGCYRICCREIKVLTGVRYDCTRIVGGGANADYLNRLTAETTGKTVYVGPTETAAIGNLVIQMIEGREFKSLKEARDSIFCSFEIKTYEPSEKV